MNIILDSEKAQDLRKKYTVLELDTFRLIPENRCVTAYCVVENVPITELALLESKKDLHEKLLSNYRRRNWNYCTQALEHLIGSFGTELDSFYLDLQARIAKYTEQDPGDAWDGIIEKTVGNQ